TDENPRTANSGEPPGTLLVDTWSPAIRPDILLTTLWVGTAPSSSPLISWTAYPRALVSRSSPNAVTTTSLSCFVSVVIATSIIDCPLIDTSVGTSPMKETTMVSAPSGT